MEMHLINILEKSNYKKYYRYFTIDRYGDMVLWKHKPRAGACGYWVYGRSEYTGYMTERVNFGTISDTFDNWKDLIWKIQ